MENETIVKLNKDLRVAAERLSQNEARFLVDNYYQMQDNRIRAQGQIRSIEKEGSAEPHAVLDWLSSNSKTLESQIKNALGAYAKSKHMGRWALAVKGIGPVLSAGLLAHIDITKCPTVGHIWAFAGLDPTRVWGKGEKRPHNAGLKVLCWKMGESFVKVKGSEGDVYGSIYEQRKALEIQRNERLEYRVQAEAVLKARPNHAQAKCYKTGMLPAGHIHARAKRYAVKLFLSHWHGEAYRDHYKTEPPLPYPIAHLNHAHVIAA